MGIEAAAHPLAGAAALPYAGPAVRRFARELGVDLVRVTGTGTDGRILAEDVQAYVRRALAGLAGMPGVRRPDADPPSGSSVQSTPEIPAAPAIDFSRFGPIQTVPLSRVKRISGPRLARNWISIPHVTSFDEADVTELDAFRRDLNAESEANAPRLTLLPFILKALASALHEFPVFNASLAGSDLVLKGYVHIGFAADTAGGLVVPVVRDVDRKGVLDIAREASRLAGRARDGKLAPAEMQGGCMSVSSLGGIGGTGFTPIINAPEIAILGVAKATRRPVWNGIAFVPRLVLPLCLSWDHRAVDGAEAGRFLARLVGLLRDPRNLLA